MARRRLAYWFRDRKGRVHRAKSSTGSVTFNPKLAATVRTAIARRRGTIVKRQVTTAPGPVTYPTATHYSEHFTRAELDCKCGCTTPPIVARKLARLASNLELLRTILGRVPVVSAYRCPARNREVGGASDSRHMRGEAADLNMNELRRDGYAQDEIFNAAERVPAFAGGGIGVYLNGGVHVDIRGWRARWNAWKAGR